MMSEYLGCNTFDFFELEEGPHAVLLRMTRDDYQAVIVTGRPATDEKAAVTEGYTLAWTDFVANHWGEHYDDLPTALARLAVLEAGAGYDWEKGFAHQPEEFSPWAREMFDRALT